MLSFFSRCQTKMYSPLYPLKNHDLQDYIRKIETDLKNKSSIALYNPVKINSKYDYLTIVGIVYFLYTFGKSLLLRKIE